MPAFILAIPLNWYLVERLDWHEAVAYALVPVIQVSINFFICRRFVFTNHNDTPMGKQFCQFVGGILGFRLADWALYTFLVRVAGLYFIGVQIANVLVFAVLKFKFSQKVLER
ncbi:MAG: GtrA family protein [Planctomycetota bacterium]